MTTAHSQFSASGSKRLINCPGSFRLSQQLPNPGARKSSVFAAEGTMAHAVAESALRSGKPVSDWLGHTAEVDGYEITVDEDMVEHVSTYVEYVRGLNALGYAVFLEVQVEPNLPWAGEEPPIHLFGTSDCVAVHYGLGHMVIADLKYGQGVLVEVHDNPQLLYYGLGSLGFLPNAFASGRAPDLEGDAFSGQVNIGTLTTTLVQPRAPHPDGPVRSQTHFVRDVVRWGENVLRPAVEAVLQPGARLRAGDHCQFCSVLAVCPEMQRTAQDKARAVFDDDAGPENPAEPGPDRLGEDLILADQLEGWIAALRDEAHRRLETGAPVKFHKLVQKRAIRRWTDEAEVRAAAAALGVGNIVLEAEPALLSPAQALKKLDKADKHASAVLAAYAIAKSSGTTLARDTDPRPAVPGRPDAAATFNDEED